MPTVNFSETARFRLPVEIMEKAKEAAAEQHMTFSEFTRRAIISQLTERGECEAA